MVLHAFGLLVLAAVVTAFATCDWRLKTVACACSILWVTTAFVVPHLPKQSWVDPAYTVVLLVLLTSIQARGAVERARGEPLAMWLLVPLSIEAMIALSYVAELWIISARQQLVFIEVGFAIELICIIVVGGRRLELGRRLREGIGGIAGLGTGTVRDGA